MSVTAKRKRSFCRALLGSVQSRIGLADVGAGGPLKEPWNVFADQDLSIYGFEPTAAEGGSGTLCVSNCSGTREFYVAADERASSLHRSNPAFVERFGLHSLLPKRVINGPSMLSHAIPPGVPPSLVITPMARSLSREIQAMA